MNRTTEAITSNHDMAKVARKQIAGSKASGTLSKRSDWLLGSYPSRLLVKLASKSPHIVSAAAASPTW